jgi:hypothetical protein
MNNFERVPLRFDFSDVTTDEMQLELKSFEDKHQKYSLALKKIRDYEHAGALLYVLDDASTKIVHAQLPPELVAVEAPEIILLTVTPEKNAKDIIFPPHIDKIRVCCVNVYLEPHGERTVYYEYDGGKMREVESFVAEDGECWVLDTTVPHAVELVYPHPRRVMSASFVRTPFKTVRQIMLDYA